jgi:hypothetical protein
LQLKLCLKYFIRNIHGYPWIYPISNLLDISMDIYCRVLILSNYLQIAPCYLFFGQPPYTINVFSCSNIQYLRLSMSLIFSINFSIINYFHENEQISFILYHHLNPYSIVSPTAYKN